MYDHALRFKVITPKFVGRLVVHTKSDYITETDKVLSKYNGMRWAKVKSSFIKKKYIVTLIAKDVFGKVTHIR